MIQFHEIQNVDKVDLDCKFERIFAKANKDAFGQLQRCFVIHALNQDTLLIM